MQIKTYAIPIIGGEQLNEEMNTFLRSKKILQMESQIVTHANTAFWSFCIRYLSDYVGRMPSSPFGHSGQKIDHQAKLDPKSAARFGQYRTIRRDLSKKEGIPAYAIFTDEQLSQDEMPTAFLCDLWHSSTGTGGRMTTQRDAT
jgi:hypothetical protein